MAQGDFRVKEMAKGRVSRWRQYSEWVVGKTSLIDFLKYELITFCVGGMPGALGYALRSKLYPLLLGAVGRNVIFGRATTLRHPHKIRIGQDVIIDDNCVLDAKGGSNVGISIGDGVFVGRNTILYCKDGDIDVQPQVNFGFNCVVFSSNRVVIGQGTMIAAYCHILSGGSYEYEDAAALDFAAQDGYAKGPTVIGKGCWLGSKVVLLDGVSIGDRTVVGAGSVVTKTLPAHVAAVGVPARILERGAAALRIKSRG